MDLSTSAKHLPSETSRISSMLDSTTATTIPTIPDDDDGHRSSPPIRSVVLPDSEGVVYVGYVGPHHVGGSFPGQEIHIGYIPSTSMDGRLRQLQLQGALRYSKFSTTFPSTAGDEWTRFWTMACVYQRCEIGPLMYSITLPNDIYGRVFDRLFTKSMPALFSAAVDELRDALADQPVLYCTIL